MKVIVTGAAGRMGRSIIAAIYEDPNLLLTGVVEKRGNKYIKQDAGILAGVGSTGLKIIDNIEEVIEEGDVIIEFTDPSATMEHLKYAHNFNKKMVIGTTGFSEEQIMQIKNCSQKIPIVLSPNMSMGVNLLFKITNEVTKVLSKDFDIEIIEAHHHHKKDAPSGTAKKLAEIVANTINKDLKEIGVYGREGLIGERKKDEIGVLSIRGGDIVGEHTVTFIGEGERIELTHKAHSRMTFAKGALKAAKWLQDKDRELYNMNDVLEI
ncbi:MAG: 4-hydroxy-tetrahydrodipicolinate reductase [bacterium]|nr:4-hydroxy-tetrahydrodipicolinate reductase [bacterium]